MTKPLSPRAKQRLKIAAKLLKLFSVEAESRDDPAFYAETVAKLEALDPKMREGIRELTDWVEQYEQAEAK